MIFCLSGQNNRSYTYVRSFTVRYDSTNQDEYILQGRGDGGGGAGGGGQQGQAGDGCLAGLCPLWRGQAGLGDQEQSDSQSAAQPDKPALHVWSDQGEMWIWYYFSWLTDCSLMIEIVRGIFSLKVCPEHGKVLSFKISCCCLKHVKNTFWPK